MSNSWACDPSSRALCDVSPNPERNSSTWSSRRMFFSKLWSPLSTLSTSSARPSEKVTNSRHFSWTNLGTPIGADWRSSHRGMGVGERRRQRFGSIARNIYLAWRGLASNNSLGHEMALAAMMWLMMVMMISVLTMASLRAGRRAGPGRAPSGPRVGPEWALDGIQGGRVAGRTFSRRRRRQERSTLRFE